MFPRARLTLGLLTALALGCGSATIARAEPVRPESARRVVRAWDFEERKIHVEPVPVGWYRAQDLPPTRVRPGFPKWNEAELSREAAQSGDYSVKLPTRGGSTSLRLSSAVLPAIPGADYAIFASVQTRGLTHARARLSAWFLDAAFKEVPSSRASGPLVRAEQAWRQTQVTLAGHPDAAWIQLELELLQPDDFDEKPLLPQQVRGHDYAGAAYFDDLAVYQVPRVEIRTTAPANMVVAPESPELEMLLRDLTGEPLTVGLTVYDVDGAAVARQSISSNASGRPFRLPLALPAFGWYRAALVVNNRDGLIAQTNTDLLYLPPGEAEFADRAAFGLIAEDTPVAQLADLPAIARRSGVGAVHMPVWTAGLNAANLDATLRAVAAAAEKLIDDRQEVTFVLREPPAPLARAVRGEPNEPLALLAGEGEEWRPYLGRVLASFGERVRRWQFGPTGGPPRFLGPEAAARLEAARAKLRKLVPRPLLTLPRSAYEPMPADLGAEALTISIPASIPADAVAGVVRGWGESADATAVLELPSAGVFGRRAAAIELVRRAVHAWRAGATRLAIRQPFGWREGRDAQTTPEASLAVWRTLARELAGREIVGELSVAAGVRAFIVQGRGESSLIAWNEAAPPDDAVIRGYLSDAPVRISDIFGNTRSAGGDASAIEIPIPETPIYIDGIDAPLARFRAGLRLEPAFLPARAEKHRVEIVIENPWPVEVQGRLRIAEPFEWTITPRVVAFNIAPESSARVPIDLAFGLAEEAGAQTMLAEVELTAERRYPLLRLPLRLEIGLESVQLLPSYRVEPAPGGAPGAGNIMVTLLISNLSDKPVTLEAFAQAPGFPAFSAPLSNLQPGASAVRRFLFEGGAKPLQGRNIRVGLKELDGTGRINKLLLVR